MRLRNVLVLPAAYAALQRVLGGASHDVFVREHVKPRTDDWILDIGCGPGRILSALPPQVHYIGVDASPRYIADARRRYGSRAAFYCARIGPDPVRELPKFQIVLAMGVLHHLDDRQASQLFERALDSLAPAGRMVTIDGCLADGQHPVARLLLKWDRGENVRSASGYAELARRVFSDVRVSVRRDLLRLPYTHAILECSR